MSFTVQLNWVAAVLLLPAASVNVLAATSMVATPVAVGVNVAVYTVLEVAEKLLKTPWLMVISPTAKLVVASLEVKVSESVPSLEVNQSAPSAAAMVMVGATPSTTKALFAPNELLPPGLAKVNVALFPSASLIVPLFNAKAVVLT